MLTRVTGTFEVKPSPLPLAYDPGPLLGRMSIEKQFHGELEGRSQGQMLSARTAVKNPAGFVAIELVTATLRGRKGSFVLQHSSTMNQGLPMQSITVVPDSGTHEGRAPRWCITRTSFGLSMAA